MKPFRPFKECHLLIGLMLMLMLTGTSRPTLANPPKNETWALSISSGGVYNLPLPLSIKQNNQPTLHLKAHFETRPFELPPYWDVCLAHVGTVKGWEAQLIHNKLYLINTTPEVQQFSISHGFNLLLGNRLFFLRYATLKIGAGIVLAHPENQIRSIKWEDGQGLFDTGYFITGPASTIGCIKTFPIFSHLYLKGEMKAISSYARIPVSEGHAEFVHLSWHGTLGIGWTLTNIPH
jgi:hypothetical protein